MVNRKVVLHSIQALVSVMVAVDMKFHIHIHIHIHRFYVDIHGYIHIHDKPGFRS